MRHLVLCCLISGCTGFQAGVFVMALLAAGRQPKTESPVGEGSAPLRLFEPRFGPRLADIQEEFQSGDLIPCGVN